MNWIPNDEGYTHINLYFRSKSKIGRALALENDQYHFDIPVHGKFRSVTSYYYWLISGENDDAYRTLNGYNAKKLFVENGVKVHFNPIKQRQYLEALEYQIYQNQELIDLIVNVTPLVFTRYIYFGLSNEVKGVKDYTRRDQKILNYLEKVRYNLKTQYNIKHEKSSLPRGLKPKFDSSQWKV